MNKQIARKIIRIDRLASEARSLINEEQCRLEKVFFFASNSLDREYSGRMVTDLGLAVGKLGQFLNSLQDSAEKARKVLKNDSVKAVKNKRKKK